MVANRGTQRERPVERTQSRVTLLALPRVGCIACESEAANIWRQQVTLFRCCRATAYTSSTLYAGM
jgi:hypothetical protein